MRYNKLVQRLTYTYTSEVYYYRQISASQLKDPKFRFLCTYAS